MREQWVRWEEKWDGPMGTVPHEYWFPLFTYHVVHLAFFTVPTVRSFLLCGWERSHCRIIRERITRNNRGTVKELNLSEMKLTIGSCSIRWVHFTFTSPSVVFISPFLPLFPLTLFAHLIRVEFELGDLLRVEREVTGKWEVSEWMNEPNERGWTSFNATVPFVPSFHSRSLLLMICWARTSTSGIRWASGGLDVHCIQSHPFTNLTNHLFHWTWTEVRWNLGLIRMEWENEPGTRSKARGEPARTWVSGVGIERVRT